MSTIRSVHQTFATLISEAKQARRDKEAGLSQAELVEREGQADARQVLVQALNAAPDPATWPASPLASQAIVQQQKVVSDREWARQELSQATPEHPEQDRLALSRLDEDLRREKGQVTESQVEFTHRCAELPSEWRSRWEKQMLGQSADRETLHVLMTAPPSRWNVMAYLGASEDQRVMWRLTRTHEHRHGEGSLARLVNQVEALNDARAQKEGNCRTIKSQAEGLRTRLSRYDDLKRQWDQQEDLPVQQRQAVLDVLRNQPEKTVREWLEAVAPDQVKPYTFALAKSVGAHRVSQGLRSHTEAITKILNKLQAPMSKLEKGVRRAPSKYISVDDAKIAHQVRAALTNMKPLDQSATAALESLNNLRVDSQSLSQARFYQRAQSAGASPDSAANWLLMWMLLEGQFNPAVAMLAGVNPALALGLGAVLPAWDQQQWDSANAVSPATSDVPTLDGPAGASSVPDISIPDITSPGLDLSPGALDLNMPPLDVLDLPSMDLNLPTLDVSIPDVSLPPMDFQIPDIQVSVPDITIDTGSFSSGGSDFTS